MAIFNIEVELDFLNEDYSIDEEIRDAVVRGIKDELLKKSTDEVVRKLDNAIAKKIEEAMKTVDNYIENFIATVTEKQIEKLKIPHKKSNWSGEVEYMPISEYVGMKYEEYLTRKIYDSKYERTNWNSEAKYSISEKHIKDYLDKTLCVQVGEMVRKAKADAEETVLKTLEMNLRDQLAVDTIKRLNIPQLLENLQQKALEYESKEK